MSKHAHKVRKVHAIVKHPASRLILFIGAICVSVLILQSLHFGHERTAVTSLGVGAVINRGIEVITDVICDRLFPHVLE